MPDFLKKNCGGEKRGQNKESCIQDKIIFTRAQLNRWDTLYSA
jgi:hypothetical protein